MPISIYSEDKWTVKSDANVQKRMVIITIIILQSFSTYRQLERCKSELEQLARSSRHASPSGSRSWLVSLNSFLKTFGKYRMKAKELSEQSGARWNKFVFLRDRPSVAARDLSSPLALQLPNWHEWWSCNMSPASWSYTGTDHTFYSATRHRLGLRMLIPRWSINVAKREVTASSGPFNAVWTNTNALSIQ